MKVAIYVRVSTLEQAESGYSIEEQVDKLTKYCEIKNWDIYEIYKDGGFSGSTIDRPAISKLITDANRHKFDAVLVYKLDRLSRSQKDTLYLIEDIFTKNKISFVSLNENFDTSTPFGKASIGILAVFAQLEREQIKERMTMGKVGRAKTGKAMSWSIIPFGYKYENGNYVPNPLEASIVQRIFSEYLNGSSITKIKETLNKEGHIGKKVNWSHRTVRIILDNPVYAGINRYLNEDYQGDHEPLVTKEVFDKVQKELIIRQKEAYKKNNNPRPFQAKYMLSGLIKCGLCGSSFEIGMNPKKKDGTRYRYYKCATRNTKKHNPTMKRNPNGCTSPNYSLNNLEKEVLTEIENFRLNPNYITSFSNQDSIFDNSAYITEMDKLEKSLEKLIDLYLDDTFSKDQLEKRRKEIETKKEVLENKLDRLEHKKPVLDPQKAIDELGKIKESIFELKYESQKRIVRYLIDSIKVYPDHLDIFWKFASN
ncbi:resolvase protein [Enterococcus faecalis 13-SD-W-01]|nr:resolvase protein [Enterococcus faecalis 13-SD-W-01]